MVSSATSVVILVVMMSAPEDVFMSTLLAIEQEACQSAKSLYKQCVIDSTQGFMRCIGAQKWVACTKLVSWRFIGQCGIK